MEKDVAGDGSKLCWSYSPFSISQKAVYFCKAHTHTKKKKRAGRQHSCVHFRQVTSPGKYK